MVDRQKKPPQGEQEVQVDAELEDRLREVERAIAAYVQSPDDRLRRSLLGSLEALDEQTARSDAYEDSVVGSGAWGYASKGEVVGETGIAPLIAEVPESELDALVALVNAAKAEVRAPSPTTLAALRSASAALVALRGTDGAAR